jgi:hypothetical protein
MNAMNYLRLRKNKWLYVGFILSIIVYSSMMPEMPELNNENDDYIELESHTNSYKHADAFQGYCMNHGEWEMLKEREIFIKRSAVFYFIDAGMLRIQMLSTPQTYSDPNRFALKVYLLRNTTLVLTLSVGKQSIMLHSHGGIKGYSAGLIQAHLKSSGKIQKKFEKNKFDTMKVVVMDKKNSLRTQRLLQVKIKYLLADKSKKKGAMHCGKCLHLTKKDDFADLEWWIKLHKMIGFEKKYLCDHQIEKDESFARLFEEHKDFLEMDQLKCIPNLQDHDYIRDQTYLKSHLQLTNGKDTAYDVEKYDIINLLTYNECYMNFIDKYRYIAVADTDEFVLPKRIEKLNRFEDVMDFVNKIDYKKAGDPFSEIKCNDVQIEHFIEKDLIPQLDTRNIKHEFSLHFKHGSNIINNIIDRLFNLLDIEIEKRNLTNMAAINNESLFDLYLEVISNERAREFKLDRAFSFTIRGRHEFEYAVSLLNVYKRTVKPFLEVNKDVVSASMNNFDRLFFVSGDLNNHVVGKTIHDTRRSMDMFIHFSTSVIHVGQGRKKPAISFHKEPGDDFVVPRNLAHLSHFRSHLNFDQPQSEVPFSTLHFDVNYFKCFFAPLILKNSDF